MNNQNDPAFEELKKDIIALTNKSFDKIETYATAMLTRIQEEISNTVVKTENKYDDMEKRLKVIEIKLGIKQWYDD